ncbi:MAG: hypothetical protein QE271_10515 [Bacteriovoracaceae bacterium]|nr:hypothetical protein [Bacteriovoracaceae bacterium]
MAFISKFKPIVREYGSCKVIAYVDEGWKNLEEAEINLQILSALSGSGWELKESLYFIAFCWKSNGLPYVDLWRFKLNPVDDHSGPLADMVVFQSTKQVTEMGVASGNTLVVLGLEELHRRKCSSLENYFIQRPELPSEFWH